MDVSENSGTPKSSILIGFSIINHPFWGTPIFGNTHMVYDYLFGSTSKIFLNGLSRVILIVSLRMVTVSSMKQSLLDYK